MTVKKMLLSSEQSQVSGQTLLTTSQTWTVPEGVFSISILAVGPGLPGSQGSGSQGSGGTGSPGGKSRYINNISVSPGQTYAVSITSTTVSFGALISDTTGGTSGVTGGTGATGATGGTALNGGSGGSGGQAVSLTNPDMLAIGAPGGAGGTGTSAGLGGAGAFPGGGGGGGGGGGASASSGAAGGQGGAGAIQIIWPGQYRVYPSVRTGYEVSNEINWSLLALPDLPTSASNRIANDGNGTWVVFPSGSNTFHYRSTDNGKTFTKITRTSTHNVRALTHLSGVFIGTSTSIPGVIRSIDGGQTWTTVSTVNASAIGTNGARVIIGGSAASGTTNGIAYSDDLGLTWTKASGGTSGGGNFTDIVFGNSIWWALNGAGPSHVSANNGASFSQDSSGTNLINGVFSGGKFQAVRATYSQIYTNVSGAADGWVQGPSNTGSEANNAISKGVDRLFLGGPGKFKQSFDEGATWTDQATLANNVSYTGRIISNVVTDGFGAYLANGNGGVLMRGDKK